MRIKLLLFTLLITQLGLSQLPNDKPTGLTDIPRVKNYQLTAAFHKERRTKLRELMPLKSVAVLFSGPIRNLSNDVDYEYHQDPNFYYLTGLNEPHSVLLIFSEKVRIGGVYTDEIIFVQPKDESMEKWEGRRLGQAGVKSKLAIEHVLINKEFTEPKINFNDFKGGVFHLPLEEDIRDVNERDKGDLYSLVKHFNIKCERTKQVDEIELKEWMAKLRQIKKEEELVLLQKAIDITCTAQTELMKSLKPGMTEYQAEALVEFCFKYYGAERPAFPSILGGGENSCIIHYTSNNKQLEGNDLLICDVGAQFKGYSADVTRTIPTDGDFSEEEALIYNLVLKAQKAGIDKCRVGNKFWDPHIAATNVIKEGLMELGIIDEEADLRNYFMHGSSHYLGLDVHDEGLYTPLEKGNVITVEPGIYISAGSNCDPKWWNIGVRIEDDILITSDNPDNLSECIPREIEEIEKLMQLPGVFDQ